METLEGARELISSERVRSVRGLVTEGEPADAILATAAEQRADLIVVGSRAMGALAGHLLGPARFHPVRIRAADRPGG